MEFCTPYNNHGRSMLNIDPAESMTEQSHKNECDINNILLKYQKTQTLEHRNQYRGEYGFATAGTYEEAMIVVAKAQSMFEDLPSHIRDRFDHNPANFLEFVQNENNADEMVKMGLAMKPTDIATHTPQIDPTTLRTALSEAINGSSQNEGDKPSKKDGEKPSKNKPSKEG